MKRVFANSACLALLALLPNAAVGHAANRPFIYRGQGYTLTLTGANSAYGSVLSGTLIHAGVRYHVSGDWIPAGDAGGDLLRFYGAPWPGAKFIGFVGLATLYSTCVPNCAAARTYNLTPVKPWGIPGARATVRLTLRA